MKNFGLLASPPVQWLIGHDRDVYAAVQAFLEDRGGDCCDVAGPPSMTELLLYRAAPKTHRLMLPLVRLHFRRVEHEGSPGVEVSCSDADMIDTWRKQAKARTAFASAAPRDGAERELG